jgi:hypothetical protein
MHTRFAETSNVKRFLAGVALVEKRGASEASWLTTVGEPGHGKTKTLQWWAVQNKGVYMRAKTNWRPHWMLSELAGELVGSQTGGSTEALFGIALRELAKQQRPIIIDEAWNMLHDARLLETLRDLSDLVENLIVLGGEHRVTNRLSMRFPQISSRITEIVEFKPASKADVRVCCDTLSEVPISDCLVEEIHRASQGYLREIKNAIARAEAFGKRNAGKAVTARDLHGQELCRDRKAGLPTVR